MIMVSALCKISNMKVTLMSIKVIMKFGKAAIAESVKKSSELPAISISDFALSFGQAFVRNFKG